MKFFNLPDLGEGIPEADIVEWHIQEGDHVKEDQIIVSVETAKAIVEVPSPVTAEVARLCGQPGDTILTGAPLVEFVSEEEDTGTVVGKLATDSTCPAEDDTFFIGSPPEDSLATPSAQGSVNELASRLGMRLTEKPAQTGYALENPEPLKGVRKFMANTMAQSHAEVVPVTLFDDADIDHWAKGEDITVRLIQAITRACQEEPALNAWFDGNTTSREVFDSVHLGLAVDSEEGLFVPVIRAADTLDAKQLRNQINAFRTAVNERTLPPSEMVGATITLSNFGVFAGKYATPVIVPPMVCIVGVGQLREEIVSVDGQAASHKILPISLTFDHRAATGGEATRFLHTLIAQLEK
ncbi:2-oxo acid dehydrogenase subunit E2 [Endozoicomonas gorgoniicola]|uniref:Dihydrolipoamide acetyltransferase component of pyruvate dehydrogenase complex n=1 Tax=Endozoicomonas gorgoniicola TaxID=1234144 RepID=A0ABT3N1J9_9GAMM|nr:dihydrolipoamide acetyltransferase family protein [Endozoicomonas gorgoniicola]MCW7555501.1 2-oxo acid dehydrogenase subunit E2 [Endozoicomonas gorgoniicola]